MNNKKKKKFSFFIIIIFVCMLYFFSKSYSDSWTGEYIYTENFLNKENGTENFVGFTISIFEKNNHTFAYINGDGWFLQTRTLTEVIEGKNQIDFFFLKTVEDDSLYGICNRYSAGEKLLSLKYDGSTLVTRWYKLRKEHPALCENSGKIEGEYFEKVLQ